QPDVGRVARHHLGRLVDDGAQPVQLLVELLGQLRGLQLVLRRQRPDVIDLLLELAPLFLGHEREAARRRHRRQQDPSDALYHDTSTRRSLAQPASSLPVASISPRALIFMSVDTPSCDMRPLTDCARLSLRARLYSSVPRGSVRPVSVTL